MSRFAYSGPKKTGPTLASRHPSVCFAAALTICLSPSPPAFSQNPPGKDFGLPAPQIGAIPTLDLASLGNLAYEFNTAVLSDEDYIVQLKVERSGKSDTKTSNFSYRGKDYWKSDVVSNWVFGPYEAEVRFPVHSEQLTRIGRARILRALGSWSDLRDHYLLILEQFAAAKIDFEGMEQQRQEYFDEVGPEIRRLMREAKTVQSDVDFLKSILNHQRHFVVKGQRSGFAYDRSDARVDTSLAGATLTEHKKTTSVYMGHVDGTTDNKDARVLKAENFSVTGEFLNSYESLPFSLALATMDLSDCTLDRLRELAEGALSRFEVLTPLSAEDLDLEDHQKVWYETTTAPLITQLHRDTYRQALYEAVRYAWFFAAQDMPTDMHLGSAKGQRAPGTSFWHLAYESPNRPGYWVDGNGAPIIRDGASLELPETLGARQLRLWVSEAGYREPRDVSPLASFSQFDTLNVESTSDSDIRHRRVSWRLANDSSYVVAEMNTIGINELHSFDFTKFDQTPHAWMSSVTSYVGSSSVSVHGTDFDTLTFVPAGDIAERLEFYKTPGFHELSVNNVALPITAQLTLNYARDRSRPKESYDIDSASQTIKISIEVDTVEPAPLREECPEPIFDDPPKLRIVEFWEHDPQDRDDNEFEEAANIWPGHPYYIEAQFDDAPPLETYKVRVDGQREVRVTRTTQDAELYRSEVITFTPQERAP